MHSAHSGDSPTKITTTISKNLLQSNENYNNHTKKYYYGVWIKETAIYNQIIKLQEKISPSLLFYSVVKY